MELECYPTENRPPEIVPGRPQRAWMDHFADRHPYRCLPLTMANTTGWEILCPVGFSMTWDGGAHQHCIKFQPDHPYPGFTDFVKSHFSRGTVTFHTGYLFRTPPGWSI
jgi:acyl carrier protein phosphodiesterase